MHKYLHGNTKSFSLTQILYLPIFGISIYMYFSTTGTVNETANGSICAGLINRFSAACRWTFSSCHSINCCKQDSSQTTHLRQVCTCSKSIAPQCLVNSDHQLQHYCGNEIKLFKCVLQLNIEVERINIPGPSSRGAPFKSLDFRLKLTFVSQNLWHWTRHLVR